MALVNPSIALSGQPVQIADPMAMYAQMAQIKNAQNQNALTQYQLGAAQRTEKSQNVLADAYSQSVDPATGAIDYNKLTGLVAAGGGGAQLPGILKSRTEQDSASTKLLSDKLALLPDAYKMADTPEAYLALHKKVHADPVLGPWLNSVGATPEKGLATLQNAVETGKFDDLRIKSMQSVSQILEGMKPMTVASGSSVYNPQTGAFTQAPVAPAAPPSMVAEFNFAKTPQGGGFKGDYQQFVTARAAAGRAPAAPSAPVAVMDPVTGKQIFVTREEALKGRMTPASAADSKPLNEGQANATAFGLRMKEADSILEDLAQKGVLRGALIESTPFVGGALGQALPSALGGTSAAQQQVNQAKSNFITAVLRKESGAVISDSEFDREDKKYFPQINDSEEVIKQKAKARKLAIKAIEVQAGPGAKEIQKYNPRAGAAGGGVDTSNPLLSQ